MKRLCAAVGLAVSMCACASGSTSPNSAAPQTLSGVVSGPTSTGVAPLAGIRVTASLTMGYASSSTVSVTTDANGFYSITAASGGVTRAEINVSATDYEHFRNNIQMNGNARVDIQLTWRQTFTVSGVVSEKTEAGVSPVEGVTVEAFACDDPTCRLYNDVSAITDRNGFYSIPGVWAGENDIWLYKEGYLVGDPAQTPCDGCDRVVTLNADARLDITVVRR